MIPNPILLFDLDRTLWDFDTNADRTYGAMFDSFGLADLCHVDFETFHERYRQINDMLWEAYRNGTVTKEQLSLRRFSYSLAAFGCNADDPEIVRLSLRMSEYYVVEATQQTVLMPGTCELLDWLDHRLPRPRMAVITNGFAEAQLPKMKTSDIDRYFDHFFLSEDLGFMKPDPRFFEKALQQMHARADECLVIGDDYEVDIVGAMRAGIRQVWYNPKGLALDANQPKPTFEIRNLLDFKDVLNALVEQ